LLFIVRRNYAQPDNNIERQLMSRPVAVASTPTDWNEALEIISFGSPEQVDGIARPLVIIMNIFIIIRGTIILALVIHVLK
jgi:hypothetical protein